MKKLCSLALAGAVLLGSLCVPCSAAGQAAAAETAAASGADSCASAGLAGGYRRYRQSHADAARPSATADVPIGNAKKADGQSAVFVTDEDTARPAVQIADGESIVLTVDVPETGLYQVQVLYRPLPGKDIDLSCALYIDGALPFSSAAGLTLTRAWKDSDERSFSDDQGNEYRPVQVEQSQWMSAWLCAKDEYLDGGYEFYLTAGTHALTLESVQEGFLLGGMTLGREWSAPTYAEYLAAHKAEGRTPESISAEPVFLEGEDAARKSHPILYSIADYSSCITQPYDVYHSLQNTIGGENWSTKGQWLQWDFTVEAAGFYQLAFRFKQNYKSGSFSVRRLTVDGAVPFAEAGQIGFSYGLGWNVTALGGDEPQYIYLTPGKHTLALEVVYGPFAEICAEVQDCVEELNVLYRKVMMITGSTPDSLRDYHLGTLIPDAPAACAALAQRLTAVTDRLAEMTGGRGAETAAVDKMALMLQDLEEDIEQLPQRLSTFNSNISSLASWLITATNQPLLLDYLRLAPVGTALPQRDAPWYRAVGNEVLRFFCSFIEDYDNIRTTAQTDKEPVNIWLSVGRDQAIVMQSLITSGFTEETGIPVDLRLIAMDVLMRAVASNTGPDLALFQDQGTVINYALRSALYDMRQFTDIDEVLARFPAEAAVPFSLNGSLYALPENLNYPVMFYRTDILEELGLSVPKTWEELYDVLTVLQKDHLEIGVVSSFTTATTTAMSSLFVSMLYQKGGAVYADDRRSCVLDRPVGVQAFTEYCELYTKYGLSLKLDLLTRFRTGESPIVINDFVFGNQLTVSAPEIDGLWKMAVLPGTTQADGTVSHASQLSCSGTVMFRNARSIENTWAFIKWWTSRDAQVGYARQIEASLGRAGRWTSANLEAMEAVAWSREEMSVLKAQLAECRALPEVAGGYYTGRSVNNAIRSVVNSGEAPKETLYEYVKDINEEILAKRRELRLD